MNTLERKERTEWTPITLGVMGKGDVVRKLKDNSYHVQVTIFSTIPPLDIYIPGIHWVPGHEVNVDGLDLVTTESGLRIVQGALDAEQIPKVLEFTWKH